MIKPGNLNLVAFTNDEQGNINQIASFRITPTPGGTDYQYDVEAHFAITLMRQDLHDLLSILAAAIEEGHAQADAITEPGRSH